MRWFLAAGLCAGLLAVAFVGCGPQIKVAGDNVVAWVNAQLGELEVKKATIEGRIAEAEKGLNKLRGAKIKAEVRLESVDQKVAPYEEKVKRTEAALAKVREHLKEVQQTSAEVQIGGKKYDQKALTEMAAKVLKEHKDNVAKVTAEKAGKPTLEKIAKSLAAKEADYSKAITEFKEKLKEINNKMIEVTAIRDAAAAAGDADKGIAANFDDLRDQMADFNGEMEVVLRQENAEFDAGNKADVEINKVDEFIEASTKTDADPLAEIDAILGKDTK